MKPRFSMLVFAILFSAWGTAAVAQQKVLRGCQIYTSASKDSPIEFKELFHKLAHSAVRVCHGSPPDAARYDLYSDLWTGNFGACYVKSTQLFRTTDSHGKGEWSFLRPDDSDPKKLSPSLNSQLFMAPADGTCPPRGDGRYVAVNQVSEGVFLTIIEFWGKMIKSEKEFDKNFAALPESQKRTEDYNSFRRMILSQSDISFVSSISYQGPIPEYGLATPNTHRSSHYLVRIRYQDDITRLVELGIDVSPDGPKIFDFRIAFK